MRRMSSRRSPSATSSFSSAREETSGHGHHVAAPEPADLAFDPALLVGPVLARAAVEGLEEVVAAQGDEALGLGPAAPHQHPGHRRLQVVVADPGRRAAEVGEGPDVAVDEGLLGLVGVDAVKALPDAESRMTNIHAEVSTPSRKKLTEPKSTSAS